MTRKRPCTWPLFCRCIPVAEPAARGEVIVTPVWHAHLSGSRHAHIHRPHRPGVFRSPFPETLSDEDCTWPSLRSGIDGRSGHHRLRGEEEVFTVEDFTSPKAVHFGLSWYPDPTPPRVPLLISPTARSSPMASCRSLSEATCTSTEPSSRKTPSVSACLRTVGLMAIVISSWISGRTALLPPQALAT